MGLMKSGWVVVVAGLVVIAGVGGAAWALRGDDGESGVVAKGEPPTATPQPAACPVDEAICEFVEQVEFEYRDGDPLNLVSRKSDHYGEIGIVDAGIGSWRDAPYYPRVIGIGCSIDPGGGLCGQAFSLVLTAYPEDQQEERLHRVLLGFMRDGDELPIVTTNRLVGGAFNPVTSGVDSGDCGLAGVRAVVARPQAMPNRRRGYR